MSVPVAFDTLNENGIGCVKSIVLFVNADVVEPNPGTLVVDQIRKLVDDVTIMNNSP